MIGRKATLSVLNMVVGSALGIVALVLIGRFFGAAANGEMTFAFSALGLLFFVTDLGMGLAHVKRVSEGRHAGDCFATYAVFKLTMTAIFLVLAGGALAVYTLVLGRTLEDTTPAALAFALVYYLAKAVQDIGQSSFEARVETAKAQLALFLDTVVRVALTALFAAVIAATLSGIGPFAGWLAGSSHPLVVWIAQNRGAALAAASAIGAVVAAVAAVAMLLRMQERGRFRMDLLRDYWTFALPLFITNSVGILATHIDGAALGLFLGKIDAGIFGAIRRIPLVLLGAGSAIAIVLFPSISAMAARDDRAGIQRAMDNAIRYLSMTLLPIVAFVVLFAEEVIRIAIGAEFVAGANALRVLCVYVVISVLAQAHGTLLLGLGHPKIAARLGILNALLVIVLDLVLIPYDIQSLGIRLAGLGVFGAAIGTLIAALVFYAGLRIATARYAGYHERGHVWKHLLATLLMVAALAALDLWVLPFGRWFHIPLYMAAGGVVYYLGLRIQREFTADDVAFIREAIHPGEMMRYIGGELRQRKP